MAKKLYFKDLSITFKPHPITGDLVTTKDEAAIKQSITNLLLTSKGERPFDSQIGSSIREYLFEPLDYGVATLIKAEIENVLRKYEPRINILNIISTPLYENNGVEVEIVYEMIGREDLPVTINFFLERTR